MLYKELVHNIIPMSEGMTINHVIQACINDYKTLTKNIKFKQIIYNEENLQYEEKIDNIIIKIIKINNIDYYFYIIS